MRRAALYGIVALVSLAACGCLGAAEPTYTNPVIPDIGPADPHVILHKGTYYLYPTGDNVSYHVYTSTDLVHWTKKGRVFEPGEKNVWAPDVFVDPTDKTFYLYYVQFPGFRITVQRMKTPLEKEGEPVELLKPTEPWEMMSGNVTEGPFLLKHQGTYYLIYSGTGASSPNYGVGYATSKSPAGPFVKHPGNPIVHRGDGVFGPGHGCVTRDAKGNLWHIYHQQRDETPGWNRFLCLDPLWFDEKGVLHGKATRGTPQPAPVCR
jgi:beta-xylosidase